MKYRSGGKFGKKHGSIIDGAEVIADISNECPHVTRVIPGVIRLRRGKSGSSRRVKASLDGNSVLLRVTSNASFQEIRVYVADLNQAISWMKHRIEREHFTFETVGI
jgi:hypothetical protein